MHLFEELNKAGTTIVIATHNHALVEEFGHPVLQLDDGELDVRRTPASPSAPPDTGAT
jgi:cell division transport system ATP-binding protein